MTLRFVNVNEEGEDYDSHATMEEAIVVWEGFPNDSIEVRGASSYGCGNEKCLACHPYHHACGNCGTRFQIPVPNDDQPHPCKNCGYDQQDPDTIDPYAKDADGFCMACGEPHESESCPIYTNGKEDQ